ncbi:MAG: hypothetical protein ABFC96_01585 [Thermoguttaceae bacterium]
MGLFSWLTEKKVKIESHRIWLTQAAKSNGIRKEVAHALADPAGPNAIIVVGHFGDCLVAVLAVGMVAAVAVLSRPAVGVGETQRKRPKSPWKRAFSAC